MNDKELADKVVELGVGNKENAATAIHHIPINGVFYYGIGGTNELVEQEFVRDWRVAGALAEQVEEFYVERLTDKRWQVQAHKEIVYVNAPWIENESLPRAISEACVEALT